MKLSLNVLLLTSLIWATAAGAFAQNQCDDVQHFVPNSQEFWDNSKHWPTNYGPAYRDANTSDTIFLPCTGTYALCFSSGPEPLPCHVDKGGRFATCKCTIETGLQFVTITSILNYPVYLETIAVCGADGSKCNTHVDKAPVCKYIQNNTLIPGAEVISDFSPQLKDRHVAAITANKPTTAPTVPITQCPKGPYAGCMTAPCKIVNGYAECSCPVFWGPFQLTQSGAQCDLGDDLIWSASYTPLTL